MNRIVLAAVCVLLTLSQAGTFTQGGQPPRSRPTSPPPKCRP